jgi:cytoskeletal protein CcmA (bactofilin family)
MAYASVIGSSSVIRGNVRGESSLEILGRVEGDVGVTGDLSLGPDAVVVGTVSGARILIGGSVEGDVTATEAVVIAETGRVVGDLSAPRIGMSEGALVRGSVRTEGAAAGTAPSRSSSARPAESRPAAPVERPAPRPIAVAAPVANSSPVAASAAGRPPAKKAPPPPVIQAPRAGVRARKRMLKR